MSKKRRPSLSRKAIADLKFLVGWAMGEVLLCDHRRAKEAEALSRAAKWLDQLIRSKERQQPLTMDDI